MQTHFHDGTEKLPDEEHVACDTVVFCIRIIDESPVVGECSASHWALNAFGLASGAARVDNIRQIVHAHLRQFVNRQVVGQVQPLLPSVIIGKHL